MPGNPAMIKSFADSRVITRCRWERGCLGKSNVLQSPLPGGQQAASPLPLAWEHSQASLVDPCSVLVQTPPSLCIITVPPPLPQAHSTHVLGKLQTETLSSLILTTFQVVFVDRFPCVTWAAPRPLRGWVASHLELSQGRWHHLRCRTEHPRDWGSHFLNSPILESPVALSGGLESPPLQGPLQALGQQRREAAQLWGECAPRPSTPSLVPFSQAQTA